MIPPAVVPLRVPTTVVDEAGVAEIMAAVDAPRRLPIVAVAAGEEAVAAILAAVVDAHPMVVVVDAHPLAVVAVAVRAAAKAEGAQAEVVGATDKPAPMIRST